jgi:putative glutamine amidotransferase
MTALVELESVFADARPLLRRRLHGMLGQPEAADDVLQETFLRAWQKAPATASREVLWAWLIKTSTNLALDELRRRRRRPEASLDAAEKLAPRETEHDVVREVLQALTPHDRFVLLMRFEAGLSSAELGRLLGVAESAARKRTERARRAFRQRFAAAQAGRSPRITVVTDDPSLDTYQRWLGDVGARVRLVERVSLRELIYSDGVVFSGRATDVHPASYGRRQAAPLRGRPDTAADRAHLAAMQTALRENVPMLSICTGHQLLNVLSGGTLHQDLPTGDPRYAKHGIHRHSVTVHGAGNVQRAVGSEAMVSSVHHQAVERLGARLRVVATSPDGLIEGIERTDHSFAIGVQWQPELSPDQTPSRLLAEAFVEQAGRRAA